MVSSVVDSAAAGLASAFMSPSPSSSSSGTGAGFGAVLAATQRAAAEQADQDAQMSEIRSKGFVAYARDVEAESFREKLREKLLKSMGLDESTLSKMPAAVRQAVEQVIEQAIQQQLDQANRGTAVAGAAGSDGAPQTASATAATPAGGQNSPGQKQPAGNGCPLIPILAWPGGPSLLG